MPFVLYEGQTEGPRTTYRRVEQIWLAGSRGPLRQHFASLGPPAVQAWHASEADLLAHVPGATATSAVLVDLKPKKRGNVSLYRLRNVWGFSYKEWTPLAVHLETIFVDRHEPDAATYKLQFTDDAEGGVPVGEFLYVQGGRDGGTWNWGMVGSVNAALRWEDAYRYLSGELEKVFES